MYQDLTVASPQAIYDKIKELEGTSLDFLGFIRMDLIGYLSFDLAKEFLKEGTTEDQWVQEDLTVEAITEVIHKYMAFAWDKANNCRGLSAGRSLDHFGAWLFLLGVDVIAPLQEYTLYGKPELRAICEFFGLSWSVWDDGVWRSDEMGKGIDPQDASGVLVPFWKK